MFKYCLLIIFLGVFDCAAQAPDPTKPLGATLASGSLVVKPEEKITLTSILISRDRKLAIINGQTLQENQILKGLGARIKTIDADAVTLQQNGKIWRVPLNSTTVRQ